MENKENQYKEFCEQNNSIPLDWKDKWTTFVLQVRSGNVDKIKEFVEDLRRIRHNELCYNKNHNKVDECRL